MLAVAVAVVVVAVIVTDSMWVCEGHASATNDRICQRFILLTFHRRKSYVFSHLPSVFLSLTLFSPARVPSLSLAADSLSLPLVFLSQQLRIGNLHAYQCVRAKEGMSVK